MKKVTARALEKSIAHWDRLASNKARDGEVVDARHCALCARFNAGDGVCAYRGEYCPVRIKTCRNYCYETPYYSARQAYGPDDHNRQDAPFRREAKKMRDFLIALREV